MSKKKNIKSLAGIVTYNSEIDRLLENVSAIYPQVDKLVIVDNGSSNVKDIKKSLKKFENIVYIEFSKNMGIAKALKDLMQYAIDNDYDWVLSLDDDSVVADGLINEYLKYIDIDNVGILSCILKDRHHDVPQHKFDKGEMYKVIPCTITSGSFMSVKKYKATYGYDEDLFIDWVDNDISFEFKLHGFDTIKINFEGLLCEISNTHIRKFLFRTLQINNYSPTRRYYRSRNELIIADRYPQLYYKNPFILNFLASVIKIFIYETNKFEKVSSILSGRKDARNYLRKHPNNVRKSNNISFKFVEKSIVHY